MGGRPGLAGHSARVPSGPTFPTFSKFCPHFIKIPTFPTCFRQPFLEDSYGSILTKKCVIINVRMLKGFCTPCLRSSISFQIHIEYARRSNQSIQVHLLYLFFVVM